MQYLPSTSKLISNELQIAEWVAGCSSVEIISVIIIEHLLVLRVVSEGLFLFSYFLDACLSLLLDEFDGSLRIIASFLVGSDGLLEGELAFGVGLDELHHSRVDLDVLELLDHSELDDDRLAKCKALRSLHGEHGLVVLLVILSQFTRNGSLLDLEGN